MKKFFNVFKEKWLRKASLTILLVILILIAFFGVNVLFKKIDLIPIDFTSQKIYSLSEESKTQIKKIEQNVEVFFFGYTENDTTVILGKQYAKLNDKININIISTKERPDLATKYGVSSNDKLVAISSSQRYKVIDATEMYTYDTTTYQTIDITEQKLTNAILDVTIVSKPKVYFLTGHGEYGISTSGEMRLLSQYIVNEVNDVNSLDLLSSDMPEVCDLLIIANPKNDFTDVETEKIIDYINKGGKIIWLQDPYINIENYNAENFKNTNKVLALYGISFSKGIVCESNSDYMISGYPDLIIPNLNYNSIVRDIYTDGKIIIPDCGKIINVSDEEMENLNVTKEVFIETTDNAYYKESFDSITGMKKTENDENGKFVLGEVLNKKIDENNTSTLIAISNAFFATNYQIQIANTYSTPLELRNNKDLLLNSVNFLTKREDAIRIRKDTGVVNFNTATASQDRAVKIFIFTFPVVLIIVGIIVTIIRKRKK